LTQNVQTPKLSVRRAMFIATEAAAYELRQEFHVPIRTPIHFTPDGVSRPRTVIAINIALLTEGRARYAG
jgi:hypothetical protein